MRRPLSARIVAPVIAASCASNLTPPPPAIPLRPRPTQSATTTNLGVEATRTTPLSSAFHQQSTHRSLRGQPSCRRARLQPASVGRRSVSIQHHHRSRPHPVGYSRARGPAARTIYTLSLPWPFSCRRARRLLLLLPHPAAVTATSVPRSRTSRAALHLLRRPDRTMVNSMESARPIMAPSVSHCHAPARSALHLPPARHYGADRQHLRRGLVARRDALSHRGAG